MKTIRSAAFSSVRLFAVAGGLSFAGLSQGAVVVTHTQDIAPVLNPYVHHTPYIPTAFTASSTDLATGLMATLSGGPVVTLEDSAGIGAWTNGSISTVYKEEGTAGNVVDHAAYGIIGSGSTVTFNLGGIHSLSSIDVFLGWNDGGRDSAAFTVSVAGADQVYTQIASQLQVVAGSGNNPNEPVTHRFRIADTEGAPITGAQYVQLVFGAADNTYAGLVEVDINAVPEPGSAVLGLLGGLALLGRKRRKNG